MNIFEMLAKEQGPVASEHICSRKGCRLEAQWALLWNNPKIHTPERRKIWLACQEHLVWLEDYLKSRSLWKETQELTLEAPSPTSEDLL